LLLQAETLVRSASGPLPLRLTPLSAAGAAAATVHGYSTAGTWSRLAWRVAEAALEVAAALPRDALAPHRPGAAIRRIEPGADPRPTARSLALFVHYSAGGGVSEMVVRQLRVLAEAGFAIAFISMAPRLAEADRAALRRLAALVVERRNYGRDFGAWRDVMGEVAERWPRLEEIMLVNDSILGPIRCPRAMFAALRGGGPGLFGLTESLQGGPHLQSYLLLARGRAALEDLALFLGGFRPSHSKWLVVRRGELRLAGWMQQRGHQVAALFGYRRLLEAALADPVELAHLADSHPLLGELPSLPRSAQLTLLEAHPLNPTQHLWTTLVRRLGFPFLKTELVRRNPGRLPNVAYWPSLVTAEAPCPAPLIQAHLASLDHTEA